MKNFKGDSMDSLSPKSRLSAHLNVSVVDTVNTGVNTMLPLRALRLADLGMENSSEPAF